MEFSDKEKDIFIRKRPISHYISQSSTNSSSSSGNMEISKFNNFTKAINETQFKNLPITTNNYYNYYNNSNNSYLSHSNVGFVSSKQILGKRLFRDDDNFQSMDSLALLKNNYNNQSKDNNKENIVNNNFGTLANSSGGCVYSQFLSNSVIHKPTTTTTTTTTTTSNNNGNVLCFGRDDECQPNKRMKLSLQIENISLQEAIDRFKKMSFLELSKLYGEGLDNKTAVNKIIDKIQSKPNYHNNNVQTNNDRSDIDSIMKLGGFSQEEANRILKIKNEIVNLKKNGFDQAGAIAELTRRLHSNSEDKINNNNNNNNNINNNITTKNNVTSNICKYNNNHFVNSSNVNYDKFILSSPHKRQHDNNIIDRDISLKRLKMENNNQGQEDDSEEELYDDEFDDDFDDDEENDSETLESILIF